MEDEVPVQVPYEALSPDALRSVLDDFCSRAGTDYGESERTLEENVQGLMVQLQSGEAALVFEANSGELRIVDRLELRRLLGE